jgi:hypothetical protein
VQQARKDEDFVVTDRIRVWVDAPAKVADALATHNASVRAEVLAVELTVGPLPAGRRTHSGRVENDTVTLAVEVVATG